MEKSGRAFFKEEFQSEEMYEQASATISDQIDFANTNINKQNSLKSAKNGSLKDLIKSSKKLSQKQKELMLKLQETITESVNLQNKNSSFSSTSSFSDKLEQINQQAADLLNSNKELAPIVAATIVAKHSMKYWQNNQEKWNKMLQKKSNMIPNAVVSAKENSDLKETIMADATGAFGGVANSFLDGTVYLTSGGGAIAEGAAGALIASGGWNAGELAGDAYDYVASFF